MEKALFILGPTGVGKTDIGLIFASKFHGNILSADSIQVYKGLNIISGKDIPHGSSFRNHIKISGIDKKYDIGFYNFNEIPVFLLDIIPPSYDFSVFDFVNCAIPVSKFVETQGKLPIFVGGTGFYVRSLIDGIGTSFIPKNQNLRDNLSNNTIAALQNLLESENKAKLSSMNTSDVNNPRRLIRAIEIARFLTKNKKTGRKLQRLDSDVLLVGLFCERNLLKTRINNRIKKRIEEGAIEEAENLFKNYENLSPQVKSASGYRQLFNFLLGKSTYDEAIEKWKYSEYLYSKNQMTWFLKDKRIKWFNISDKMFEKNVEQEVNNWYNKN